MLNECKISKDRSSHEDFLQGSEYIWHYNEYQYDVATALAAALLAFYYLRLAKLFLLLLVLPSFFHPLHLFLHVAHSTATSCHLFEQVLLLGACVNVASLRPRLLLCPLLEMHAGPSERLEGKSGSSVACPEHLSAAHAAIHSTWAPLVHHALHHSFQEVGHRITPWSAAPRPHLSK